MRHKKRRHHYISSFYINNFALSNSQKVHVHDSMEEKFYYKNAGDILHLRDFNRVEAGGGVFESNPLAYEDYFSERESNVAPTIAKLVSGSSDVAKQEFDELLYYFSLMMFRSPRSEKIKAAELMLSNELGTTALRNMTLDDFKSKMCDISSSDDRRVELKNIIQSNRESFINIHNQGALDYHNQLKKRRWSLVSAGESFLYCTDRPVIYYSLDDRLTYGQVEWVRPNVMDCILVIPISYNMMLVSYPPMCNCFVAYPEEISILKIRAHQVIQKDRYVISPYTFKYPAGNPRFICNSDSLLEAFEAHLLVVRDGYRRSILV